MHEYLSLDHESYQHFCKQDVDRHTKDCPVIILFTKLLAQGKFDLIKGMSWTFSLRDDKVRARHVEGISTFIFHMIQL